MFAVVAAVLIALYAFGIGRSNGVVNLFDLGVASWALHFGESWLRSLAARHHRTPPQQQ